MEGPNLEEKYQPVQEKVGDELPNVEQLERDGLSAELKALQQEVQELRVQKERRVQLELGMLDRIKELEVENAAFRGATSEGVADFIADLQRDNIAMKEALEKRTEQATHDQLTGLLNRHGFEEEVRPVFKAFIQRGQAEGMDQRASEPIDFSVITLDIDKFKNINDTYGHPAGDAALEKLAEIMKTNLRDNDTIARIGGEEFVVALVGLAPGARYKVAEKLRKAIEEAEFIYDGKRIPLTASFGTARYQGEQPDSGIPDDKRVMNVVNKVLGRADNAMYEAKHTGRNRVVVAEVLEEELAGKRQEGESAA